ncbi:MAG: site-specific DNA-methyltransferase [Bacteroidaceae bacterium]|nr:site-specific DNA-methyltransferase [Bacteroidaceae bacterium]
MEKLKMQTTNIVDENIKKIGELFPNCLTERLNAEGKPEVAIDFDQLRQELSKDIVEGQEERYQFTWPDKRNAIRLANAPTTDTLRPCREESVDFDNTQNLYIEGDNLQVLKLLRENYLGKVKMIYIDPPYNTGNDFVYNDNFDQDKQEYVHNSGQYDEEGNQLVTNTESNGRFHTDWLNMIYPRLKVAKDLLSDDGVIFISIDDNEVENLRKVCDEIFGSINFASPFIWSLPRGINAGLIARAHEYILCYTKNIFAVGRFNRLSDDVEYSIERCNKKIDSRHPESTIDFPSGIRYEGPDKTLEGEIEGSETIRIIGREVFKNGSLVEPVTLSAGWTMKNMILDWLAGREVYDTKGQKIVEFFFKDNGKLYSKKELNTYSIKSILKDIADTQKARIEIEELFGNQDIFSYPKTVDLPKLFSKLSTNKDSVILDFFSGSATTAHAVMQLNAEDGGNRKFIMVQLPEKTDGNSEARKAGYKNICEIGKERIRRAGKKIKEEHPEAKNLDTGFRVLKLDSSNMQDVYYTPADFNDRDLFEENIKPDRTDEDLLFQTMIELGIELSAKTIKTEIAGKTVWNVSDGYLLACFDEEVNETTITEIAKQHPYYFVMRDSSLANDNVADNFEQIFEHYSKGTIRRIL